MGIRSTLYKLLRISNDIIAIFRGRFIQRIGRRAASDKPGDFSVVFLKKYYSVGKNNQYLLRLYSSLVNAFL